MSDPLRVVMQRVARELYPLRCRYEALAESHMLLSVYHAAESTVICSCYLSVEELNNPGVVDGFIQTALAQTDQRRTIDQS
ncbi:hypothetical protein [Pseudomonas sp.]|uniref:hypothetical protein n=1 Tax=Pseudomonas sp. TaxID=306 RepID=UPI001ED97C15|nr:MULTISPECIES: hypothetical protein [Pseudomonas]